MLLSAMGGAALAVFAMAAFIVGGRSDDFPAARVPLAAGFSRARGGERDYPGAGVGGETLKRAAAVPAIWAVSFEKDVSGSGRRSE